MEAKVALVREAGAEHNLGQTELAICPQEVLRSFDPAGDYKLVRRQSGGSFKLPGKVIGAEVNYPRHLLQGRIVFQIFHNVLNNPTDLGAWKYTVRCCLQPPGTRNVTDQMNGQNIGE